MVNNYRLLVAGIAPRPVGFASTISEDGKSKNLSPCSYFQVIDHDPPMFIIGFSSRHGRGERKTHLATSETQGNVLLIPCRKIMIEAVNASSIDAPYGVSEWDVFGLHEAGTTTVKPSRGLVGKRVCSRLTPRWLISKNLQVPQRP
ncbi:hypothetical protein J3458_009502 [Metarhizium acridum]|uniref:uncharacterized protein n=1 Tax=Metarhizium acridum TaxID=92637 RepID=UPI001C6BC51B|nr:hypothetical protein J3458_009502 [Metarhizium acridum]